MVDVRVDQGGMYALVGSEPEVRVDQGGIYALINSGVDLRVDQAGMYSLTGITPVVPVAQAGMYCLASGSPCTTQWAQVWKITRIDGEVFRFTSKDTDWVWLGEEYKACDSMVPSASESVSEVDAAGSINLSGAVGPDGITLRDLYGGLFDGATVEAWLVPWAGAGTMRLLLRGTFGPVELGETGYSVDLLGDGAKLQQTPLISLLKPGCRWQFGDPTTCGVDLVPLTVTGAVDSGVGQREFTDAARVETAGYFSRGRVTFTTGDNAGISAEIKEHLAGGVFTLWPRLPYGVSAGDQYSMTPGCTNIKEADGGTNGCQAWANLVRYGGFLKVPGGDKRNAAADVR